MPAPEYSSLEDKAVLFIANGVDAYGETIVESPIEIDVRWEEVSKDVQSPEHGTVHIEVEVCVDRDIPLNSLLWLGEVADLPSPLVTLPGLKQVYSKEYIPDIKGREVSRSVNCMGFGSVVPQIRGTGT